jgi:ParB family chromosome partitioning protein
MSIATSKAIKGKEAKLARTAGHVAAESVGPRKSALAKLDQRVAARQKGVKSAVGVVQIRVDRLEPDEEQPRQNFDEAELHMLAESLKSRGQLQPIRVRYELKSDTYVIIAGERRWRAAQLAGLTELTAVIESRTQTKDDLLIDQVTENIARADLGPIDEAFAFQKLIELRKCSVSDLAKTLGLSQGRVSKSLALLKLSIRVRIMIEEGKIGPAIGYELSRVGNGDFQMEFADEAYSRGLSRDAVAKMVDAHLGKSKPQDPKRPDVILEIPSGLLPKRPLPIHLELEALAEKFKKTLEPIPRESKVVKPVPLQRVEPEPEDRDNEIPAEFQAIEVNDPLQFYEGSLEYPFVLGHGVTVIISYDERKNNPVNPVQALEWALSSARYRFRPVQGGGR